MEATAHRPDDEGYGPPNWAERYRCILTASIVEPIATRLEGRRHPQWRDRGDPMLGDGDGGDVVDDDGREDGDVDDWGDREEGGSPARDCCW